MSMIPNAAAIAAVNAYNDSPFAETALQGMNRALEAAIPLVFEAYGFFTHPDHPGYVGRPNSKHSGVVVWKKGSAPQFIPFSPTDAEREWFHPDAQECAKFARAYFDSIKPTTCGIECPFMNGLHCVLDPHDDGAHEVTTGAGMTVTWREAD